MKNSHGLPILDETPRFGVPETTRDGKPIVACRYCDARVTLLREGTRVRLRNAYSDTPHICRERRRQAQ